MVTDLRYVLIIAVVFLVYRQYANKDYERLAFNFGPPQSFWKRLPPWFTAIGGGWCDRFFCHLGNFNPAMRVSPIVVGGPGLIVITPVSLFCLRRRLGEPLLSAPRVTPS